MASKKELTLVEKLKVQAIPLHTATFHRAITSGYDGTPETALYASGSNKKSRQAHLWYTQAGVLIEQKSLKGKLVTKLIPLANVSDTELA